MKNARLLSIIGLVLVALFSVRFFFYSYKIFFFPYEWEPTDGDHVNFAIRLLEHRPIYTNKVHGWVLSIYNPLYHYTIAYLSLIFKPVSLVMFARQLSIIFMLAPVFIFFISVYSEVKKHLLLVLFFSFVVLFPYLDMYAPDLTNASANSYVIFLFALTTFLLEKFFKNTSYQNYFFAALLSLLSVMVFLSKQQGVIALPLFVITIAFLKIDLHRKKAFIGLFLTVGLLILAFLLQQHGRDYIISTLIDTGRIIGSDWNLSFTRFFSFVRNNIIFILGAIYYIYSCYENKKFDVWATSFVIHIPLLLKILGNGGGGNNYFGTFWITMVVLNFKLLLQLLQFSRQRYFTVALSLMIINTGLGLYKLDKETRAPYLNPPTAESVIISQTHYALVKNLVQSLPKDALFLVNRNIDALNLFGFDINIEGCTTFGYLWPKPTIFDRNIIKNNITQKKYAMIFTGVQLYPPEIEALIAENYKVEATSPTHFIFNNVGEMKIYSPKTD